MGAAGAIAAIAAVISAATSAYSIDTQNKAAEAEAETQDNYNEALQEEAIRQYGELHEAEADAIHQSYAESLQAQRQYLTAKSQVNLAAAATGTYGQSVGLAIGDLNKGLTYTLADINYSRESVLDQSENQAEGIQANAEAGMVSSLTAPSYVSAFSTGLSTYGTVSDVGTKVHSAYTAYTAATPATTVTAT